jgi:hypothetical protein
MDDNNDDFSYDRCDKAYDKSVMDKYYEDLDGYYGSIQKFKNYEELLLVSKHEDTNYTLKNIVYSLIKAVVKLKCTEVSFKFDFKLGPYESWIDIAEYFNSNHVGSDYRILIDEDAIVCVLLN